MLQGAAINGILSLIVSFAVIFSPFPLKTGKPVREEKLGKYSYSVCESELEKGFARYRQKVYSFENGEVLMLRAERASDPEENGAQSAADPVPVTFFELDAYDADAVLYAGAKSESLRLSEGLYRCDSAVITTEGSSVFIDMPKNYADLGSEVAEQTGDHLSYLRVVKNGRRLRISAVSPVSDDICDCLVLKVSGSKKSDCPGAAAIWNSYLEDGEAKWLYDGYYRTVPAAYIPTSEENGYYRCPASFIINVLADKMKENRAAAYLALSCWDTVMQNQSEDGSWRTAPESVWLSGDYGISGGFYDTRFNTDLMLTGCLISERTGVLPQKESVAKYAEFYLGYLKENSTETENGGLLAADYTGPGQSSAVHTSLNHQAAEALAAFKLSKLLKNDGLAEAAEKLLLGIDSGAEAWIKPDGDLWYCTLPQGGYFRKDYESLTYDDLLTLQRYLSDQGRQKDETIEMLLSSKLLWMKANNIGDFLK